MTAESLESGNYAKIRETVAATAAEQQAATAMQLNASVEQIAQVTRQTERSMEDVTRSAEELARIAEELARTAAWFKTAAKAAVPDRETKQGCPPPGAAFSVRSCTFSKSALK